MRELERGEHAGDADRASALHRLIARQRLAGRVEEQIRRRRGRRGLAPVEIQQGLAHRVPGEKKRAAADPRGLRLDDTEHHLRGDGRVDGAAAFAQDGKSCLGGERVRRHHHLPLGLDERLRREAARPFRTFVGAQRCASTEGEDKCQRYSNQCALIDVQHACSIAGLAALALSATSWRQDRDPLSPWGEGGVEGASKSGSRQSPHPARASSCRPLPRGERLASLMEVAGFGDDALGAGVSARIPTRMGFLAWRERPLDVIGWRNGKRRLLLVRRRAP